MGTFIQDLRFALRMLLKSPGFTVAALLILGLAIGGNAVIFSYVHAILIRPLPYPDPDRLVWVWQKDWRQGGARQLLSAANFVQVRDQTHVFGAIAACQFRQLSLTGRDEPEHLVAGAVPASLFPLLGKKASLGRTFLQGEERAGHGRVVLLDQRFWQRRFGADPNIIGQSLTLNGEGYTVIGILPQDSFFSMIDLWVPSDFDSEAKAGQELLQLNVWARLKSEVTLEQANAELNVIARRLEQKSPEKGLGFQLEPLKEVQVRDLRPALLILLGAVAMVLLIACANLANLILARASGRRKEMAIRMALGASRQHLVRQQLTETVLLGLLGGLAGLLMAVWGVELSARLIPDISVSQLDKVGVSGGVISFTLFVSLLTGILCGLAPALQSSPIMLHQRLKEAGRATTAGAGISRLRNFLVTAELALALVLSIGAGLLIKSIRWLDTVGRGFNSEHILSMWMPLPQSKYPTEHQRAVFFQQVLERIRHLPGVESASLIHSFASNGWSPSGRFNVEGRTFTELEQIPSASYRVIDSDYFRTMGIPLLKGRVFTEKDRDVVLINQTLAKRLWPNDDPIGRRIKPEGSPHEARWLTIIGVAGDVRFWGDLEPTPEVFQNYLQYPESMMGVLVRTSSDPFRMVPTLRAEVRAVDPEQPVSNIDTLTHFFSMLFWRERFSASVLNLFAVLALLLAAVGIYAVASYSVTQRTHEIGIRMALGAQRSDVLRLVVGAGMVLAVTGVAIGLAAAFAFTRILSSLLYGVAATDPAIFVGVSLLLSGVALLASYIPARRATKVDPMVALRCE